MDEAPSTEALHETTASASDDRRPPSAALARRRQQHPAIFDATLKEIFLGEKVQLGEPIASAGLHTVVYSGYYAGQDVAIKILTLAADTMRDAISTYGSFKVESEKAMVLSQRHDCILQVLEYGDAEVPEHMPAELKSFFPLDLVPFMIMERARYGSLDTVVRNLRRFPSFDRMSLLAALCQATEGIKEAHEHGIAHRDIKPQNILIFGPRNGKITDFGIARWRRRYRDHDIAELTPKYCSPEQAFYALTKQAEKEIGISGDIYSWAMMVYELVTGRHPFAWVLKQGMEPKVGQRAILQAIAANDRRGFLPIGDITFDSLMTMCTKPLKLRITDIALANRILRQFVERQSRQ
jgi:serine/threonine protein kinase